MALLRNYEVTNYYVICLIRCHINMLVSYLEVTKFYEKSGITIPARHINAKWMDKNKY